MNKKTLDQATEFIKTNATATFCPFAYYDKHLDCIRVRIKDCSMIETRMNHIFTIVTDLHSPEQKDPVGFNIKGIRYLFEELSLPKAGVIRLTSIIDKIVKIYPDGAAKIVCKTFRDAVEHMELDLDLGVAA